MPMQRPYRRTGLSQRDLKVSEIERRWGPTPAALSLKLDDAADILGLDARSYAMVVNALIDDPAAHAADPRTMEHLRSIRDARRDIAG